MALSPGTRLGPYEITALIGLGGMGEVYKATDTNLKRAVAIKVLPESVASDSDRLARFQREAEVLAALNHPHIAQIHGLERSGGTIALVMELVEGPTLADRIAHGAIPLDEALPITKQIAEALEAAHEQGIIHRDLKPANIKVRPDGTVKVLDFGLAKAMDPVGAMAANVSQLPTITSPALMTGAGVILGTAAYMSPEQARGKAVDMRTDIWAFGSVLYEMLTGQRAFQGEDVGETLAAVVKSDVDWGRLPGATPAGIRTLLRRCLRKDPRQRLGDAGATRIEIEDALAAPAADAAPQVPLWQRVVPLRVAVPIGLGSVAVALAIGAWLRPPAVPVVSSGTARVTLPLSPGTELSDGSSVVMSPDGTQVAYVARQGGIPQLYMRSMNGSEARPITGTQGAEAPFFSPDGAWLGFFANGTLKKVSTSGGVVVTIAEALTGGAGTGGAWGPSDTIVVRGEASLVEIPAAGGVVRPLLTPEQIAAGGQANSPEFLPGGETLLVTSTRPGGDTPDDRSIDVLSKRTGVRKVLIQGGNSARYLLTGHLVFLRDGALWAVPFDLGRLELAGTPVEVLAGVRATFNGAGAFSCSRGGSCVYVAGAALAQRTVALVDRTGATRSSPLPAKSYGQPRFSPSGDKVSFWIEQLRCDVEVWDMARNTVTRLVSEGDNHYPVWTPDGQRITYESRRPSVPGSQLLSQLANGGGSEEIVATTEGTARPSQLSWSPSGVLAFAQAGDIRWLPGSGAGEPTPFVPSRFTETMPAFSPDGQWLAYVADDSGRLEVYVRPFPGPGEKHTVSAAGGSEPVWARSGRELYFRNGDQMMAAEVSLQPVFSAGRPKVLFTGNFARTVGRINYDVSPDGESFVMLIPGEEDGAATQIGVLLNWSEELMRLVPTQ